MRTRLHLADGTSAPVYRETVADRGATLDPCVLVVEFRLRAVRGLGHAAFRRESLLNTPLFAGFPGFVSKLWLASRWSKVEVDRFDRRDRSKVRRIPIFRLPRERLLLPMQIIDLKGIAWLEDEPSFASKAAHRQAYLHYLVNRLVAPRAFALEAIRARSQHV